MKIVKNYEADILSVSSKTIYGSNLRYQLCL